MRSEGPWRILHVEDETADHRVVSRILRREASGRFELVWKQSLAEGIAALQNEPFDVVLLDLGLPDMVGTGVIEGIASSGVAVPIVALSGTVTAHQSLDLLGVGAHDFLSKEEVFQPGVLRRALRYAMERFEDRRTLQVRAEQLAQELMRTRAGFDALFEADVIGVMRVDREGRILSANRRMVATCGQQSARLQSAGLRVEDLASADQRAALAQMVRSIFDAGAAPAKERILQTPDGRSVTVAMGGAAIRGADQALLFVLDMTRTAALRQQVGQAYNTEAIGRLAHGIASDFNNLLSVILGYAELAAEGVGDVPAVQEDLAAVTDAARRCMELVRRLMTLGRRDTIRTRPVDMSELLEDNALMLRRALGQDVKVRLSVQASRCVLGDADLLEQVAMNLALQSSKTMNGGGVITMTVRDATWTDGTLADIGLAPSEHGYVEWLVSDDGIGLSESELKSLFEPQVSADGETVASGLNMAIVSTILRQHGGHIEADAIQGRGTTYRMILPAAAGEAPIKQRRTSGRYEGATKTILLVEADPDLRGLLCRHLSESGFVVLQAADGRAALFEMDRFAGTIHMVVTEVALPSMDGRDLAGRVIARHKNAQVLFITGQASGSSDFSRTPLTLPAVLPKPFSKDQLLDAVSSIFDEVGVH